MSKNNSLGAIPGSREPDPGFTGSGPAGFDPGRMTADWLVTLISDYGGGYRLGTFCVSKAFHARYPEFVALRTVHKSRGATPSESMVAALVEFAEAIAMTARVRRTSPGHWSADAQPYSGEVNRG